MIFPVLKMLQFKNFFISSFFMKFLTHFKSVFDMFSEIYICNSVCVYVFKHVSLLIA